MSNDRQRGVMLRKMDRDALSAMAVAHLKVSHPDVEWVGANPEYDYVVGTAEAEDKSFIICTEGVGWEFSHAKPFTMWVSPLWVDPEDGKTVGGMSTASTPIYLHPDEVRRATSDVEVDLADFVRTFGSRLEGNFHLWHRTFTAKPKAARKR